MDWTTKKPTKEGFYWIRFEERFEHLGVVEITRIDGMLHIFFPGGDENYELVDCFDAEWYGPLEPPIRR
jgi:hypothetical protein